MSELGQAALESEALKVLERCVLARGLNYFLQKGSQEPFRLAPERIEAVIRLATRHFEAPARRDVEEARARVREALIQRLAERMVRLGL